MNQFWSIEGVNQFWSIACLQVVVDDSTVTKVSQIVLFTINIMLMSIAPLVRVTCGYRRLSLTLPARCVMLSTPGRARA